MPADVGNIYLIEYSINQGETFEVEDGAYVGSIEKYDFNYMIPLYGKNLVVRVTNNTTNEVIIYTYDSSEIRFLSHMTVIENRYMCVIGKNEFTKSTNPTLFDSNMNEIETNDMVDTNNEHITFQKDENFSPYVTSIGLYDETNQLVAYAKMANPLKLNRNIESIIVVKFDS